MLPTNARGHLPMASSAEVSVPCGSFHKYFVDFELQICTNFEVSMVCINFFSGYTVPAK